MRRDTSIIHLSEQQGVFVLVGIDTRNLNKCMEIAHRCAAYQKIKFGVKRRLVHVCL